MLEELQKFSEKRRQREILTHQTSVQVNDTENVVEPSENCFNVQSSCYCTAISMMLMKHNKMCLAKETHLL